MRARSSAAAPCAVAAVVVAEQPQHLGELGASPTRARAPRPRPRASTSVREPLAGRVEVAAGRASATPTSSSIQGSAKLPPCSSVCAWMREQLLARGSAPGPRPGRAARGGAGGAIGGRLADLRRHVDRPAAAARRPRRARRAGSAGRPARTRTRRASRDRRAARAAPAARRTPSTQAASSCRNQATPRSSASARAAMYSSSARRGSARAARRAPARVGEEAVVGEHAASRATRRLLARRPRPPARWRGRSRPSCRRSTPTRRARAPAAPAAGRAAASARAYAASASRKRARARNQKSSARHSRSAFAGVGLERAVERRGEVRRLRVERGEHLGLARREHVLAARSASARNSVAMAVARASVSPTAQPLERVLAHGLQQPVATIVRRRGTQRVLDERLERRPAQQTARARARAPRRRGTPPARTARAGLGVQQPVAPVQRRPQRLARLGRARREQVQRVLEPARDRRRARARRRAPRPARARAACPRAGGRSPRPRARHRRAPAPGSTRPARSWNSRRGRRAARAAGPPSASRRRIASGTRLVASIVSRGQAPAAPRPRARPPRRGARSCRARAARAGRRGSATAASSSASAGQRAHVERAAQRRRDGAVRRRARQRDPPDAPSRRPARRLDREPRLADAARARERQQPRARQRPRHAVELALAADQRRQLRWDHAPNDAARGALFRERAQHQRDRPFEPELGPDHELRRGGALVRRSSARSRSARLSAAGSQMISAISPAGPRELAILEAPVELAVPDQRPDHVHDGRRRRRLGPALEIAAAERRLRGVDRLAAALVPRVRIAHVPQRPRRICPMCAWSDILVTRRRERG